MVFIDTSYFIGQINIANLATSGTPLEDGNELTNVYIPKYENEYLRKALGYEFWQLFINGLTDDPIPQRWLDLRDGVEYTVGGNTYKWDGFVNDEKNSPIAFYVYSIYTSEVSVSTTGIGSVINEKQNSVSVTSAPKIGNAWAQMRYLNTNLYYFLTQENQVYPEFKLWLTEFLGSRNQFSI